jgi:hypothetical protein
MKHGEWNSMFQMIWLSAEVIKKRLKAKAKN